MVTRFTCPVDGTALVPIERSGIEIDHCPECRGVWLDRGELDKIVERNAQPIREPHYASEQQQRGGSFFGGGRPDPERPGHPHNGHPHKRRKSFLEELFD